MKRPVPTRVFIADDHTLFRAGLKTMLEGYEGIEVVGEASDGRAALEAMEKSNPDILLLDISMPGLNGLETLRRLRAMKATVRVIILSMYSDRHFVVEAFRAGARGYVLKDSALQELVESVKVVQSGKVYLSSSVAGFVVDDYVALAGDGGPAGTDLSGREREVLQLIAEGKSTKETAAQLCLSAKTVESHRKRIMDKLNLHSIAELTRYAIREKMIPGE